MLTDMEEAWKGICYDDGTGRNVLYVDVKGQVINLYLAVLLTLLMK